MALLGTQCILAQMPKPDRGPMPKMPLQIKPDPRVQQRKYHFAATNEDLSYVLYASSKATKEKKNPLIVALHGLGGDGNFLVRERLVDGSHIRLIRGSGVDLDRFKASDLPPGRPMVLLMSRMLWDKGVGEFVDAARTAEERGADARFVLVGDPDPENPAAIPRETLQRWSDSGVVEWWGQRSDAPALLAQARVVVLPSYREGLPKVLLEAAASGRPMIATDVPGCREVVEPGVTGQLVPARDAAGLAEAMLGLLADPERCRQMGTQARRLAEREFGVEAVVSRTLAVYRECLQR